MPFHRYRTQPLAAWGAAVVGVVLAAIAALAFRDVSWLVLGVGVAAETALSMRNVRPRVWWFGAAVAVLAAGVVVWSQASSGAWHEIGTLLMSGAICAGVVVGVLRLSHNPGTT